jgi:hypothetical protein
MQATDILNRINNTKWEKLSPDAQAKQFSSDMADL